MSRKLLINKFKRPHNRCETYLYAKTSMIYEKTKYRCSTRNTLVQNLTVIKADLQRILLVTHTYYN